MSSNIHINSLKSVKIEVLAQETKAHLSWATGFILVANEKYYLVTNWHVVSGKHYQTKEILHHSAALPGFLNLSLQVAVNRTDNETESGTCSINNVHLYNSQFANGIREYTSDPLWHEHPTLLSDMDVVVLDVSSFLCEGEGINVHGYELSREAENDSMLEVTDDVFIVGFPLPSNTSPNVYPIYKAASIASEPNVFPDDLPMFYVDGKTKPGMSGSPVIKKHRFKVNQEGGKITFTDSRTDLVGIYSGRDSGDDEYQAELGIVWRLEEALFPILGPVAV